MGTAAPEPSMDDRPEIVPTPRMPVSRAWLDEMQRRQTVYAAMRRRQTDAFLRGEQPEPPTETERRGERGSRTIYDRRQFRFDL